MMAKTLKVGIVGYGRMGAALARNINAHSGFEIAAVCDPRQDIVGQATHKDYRTAYYTADYNTLLQDNKIDTIVIATLPDSHYELAKTALEAGKNVLVEKPLSQTLSQTEELVGLAKQKNLRLMVDHTLLYEDATQTLQQEFARETYGKPKNFSFTRIQQYTDRLKHRNCFEELAPHVFSTLDMLDNYQSNGATIQHVAGDLQRSADINVKMESGLEGTVHIEFAENIDAQGEKRQTSITFHPKKISQDDSINHTALWDEVRDGEGQQTITISNQQNVVVKTIKTGKDLPLKAVTQDLYDSVSQGREPKSSGETAIRVMQMMDAVQCSQQQGSPVDIMLAPYKPITTLRAVG